jgi:hypothetical protein
MSTNVGETLKALESMSFVCRTLARVECQIIEYCFRDVATSVSISLVNNPG